MEILNVSLDQMQEFIGKFYEKNINLIATKNADYGAKSNDQFNNFTILSKIAPNIAKSTEIGFVTRMMDKMVRITSFVDSGNLSHEAVEDSLADIANYAALFAAYLHFRKTGVSDMMSDTPLTPPVDTPTKPAEHI